MARKGQASIQDNVENNEEFEAYLEAHFDILICMEVYSEFCGHCLATQGAVRKGKLEIGQDRIAMVKAQSDNIDVLKRFKHKSEPTFLFIMDLFELIFHQQKGKLTRAMFGANGIELCRIIEEELNLQKREIETGVPVPKFDIDEMLPEEAAKLEEDRKMELEYHDATERLAVLTQAARKKRVCERLAANLRSLNFIMFWPHCHQAHYDLYEKWDNISINVSAKETFQLTEESAKEALYMSDIDANEACMYALLHGEVLVVLFKIFDTDDRDFVQLLRYALYEEIPVPKDDLPPEKQLPPIPAFERYATISKTAREVRRERYNAKLAKLKKEQEDRERLAAEQARLAREAEEERLREEKQKADEQRMARLAAGLPPEPEPQPEPAPEQKPEGAEGAVEGEEGEKALTDVTDTTDATPATPATEASEAAEPLAEGEVPPAEVEGERGDGDIEKEVVEEVFDSDVEVEGEEYIPPGGLFVPGLYAPPNELAKANAIAFFYPKIVATITQIESEYLPPHVLVMFTVDKRHEVLDVVQQFPEEVINYGFFVGDEPYNSEHVAYTLKQYEKMIRPRRFKDRLALCVSRKRSLPLLQLASFNPCFISSDVHAGERDCLALFPVGYGDDYVEEPSVKEEEIKEHRLTLTMRVTWVIDVIVHHPPPAHGGGCMDFTYALGSLLGHMQEVLAPVEQEPEPQGPTEQPEEEDEEEEEDV